MALQIRSVPLVYSVKYCRYKNVSQTGTFPSAVTLCRGTCGPPSWSWSPSCWRTTWGGLVSWWSLNLPGFATFTMMYPTNMVYSNIMGIRFTMVDLMFLCCTGLNHNYRLKTQAVTTMYDSLQPCDHHHGWGRRRGSGINIHYVFLYLP